ncbi:MAG TPA: imidazoleglycerol-phosphate dehydratase HisB [Chloroflexota bacterium]|nr:imidazoleglycerol-phosphate dehydratase HisB [Chloroflexota bacterium]
MSTLQNGQPETARRQSRTAEHSRTTRETEIAVSLDLDGTGRAEIDTGLAFFDHMLDQLARHGMFDVTLRCRGDLQVDAHHTVEDCGRLLGKAFDHALGSREGIRRMGHALVPMDEALAQVAVDLSGRGYYVGDLSGAGASNVGLGTPLLEHFFESLAAEAKLTLHVHVLAGRDGHHQAEAVFKALARALSDAVSLDPRRAGILPSTKGTLTG